ncbi:hypothetical protein BD289DRAFT_220625 [Coniella lustricola]|uniref:Uncharacterized protein n=1 Tax=Coniella lustricola TaxID=2025994 RepID=A0A2T3ALN7_9PEZI|nr:hypothetical protein BD289DRAFT_220625 [Coniella lustricola]
MSRSKNIWSSHLSLRTPMRLHVRHADRLNCEYLVIIQDQGSLTLAHACGLFLTWNDLSGYQGTSCGLSAGCYLSRIPGSGSFRMRMFSSFLFCSYGSNCRYFYFAAALVHNHYHGLGVLALLHSHERIANLQRAAFQYGFAPRTDGVVRHFQLNDMLYLDWNT